jgi:hypothetical protein
VRVGGRGVFARRRLEVGERLAVFGGEIYDARWLAAAEPGLRRLTLQVDEDSFLVSMVEAPADWINHSCRPNAGFRDRVTLVAMRTIQPGEEICFDYAMSDGFPYDEFVCECGAPECRGRVTADDWRKPELWTRYAGYFSPYLKRRIDQLCRDPGPAEVVHLQFSTSH